MYRGSGEEVEEAGTQIQVVSVYYNYVQEVQNMSYNPRLCWFLLRVHCELWELF